MVSINKLSYRVGIGAEQLGGYDWGNIEVKNIEESIERAIGNKLILIDTADCYGIGLSEIRLGNVIRQKRDNVFLSTKFGTRFNVKGEVYYDNSVEYAEEALFKSLKRLKTDYIDLYQIHWPDNKTALVKIFDKLESFVSKKYIGAYGLCNFNLKHILNLKENWPSFKTFSSQYNLLNNAEKHNINSTCKKLNLKYISYGVLAQGLLTGKYGSQSKFTSNDRRRNKTYKNFHGTKFIENLNKIKRLRELCSLISKFSLTKIAIRYVVDSIPKSIALVGIKNKNQLMECLEVEKFKLSSEDINKLEEVIKVNDIKDN